MPKPTKDSQKQPGKTKQTTKKVAKPIARQTTQTQGTGNLQRRPYEKDYNIWATAGTDGSAGQTYGYVAEENTFGTPGKTFTPLRQDRKYSNPKGSNAAGTERATRRDPFLEGFNSGATTTQRKRRK